MVPMNVLRFVLLLALWIMPAVEYALRALFVLRGPGWRFSKPAFGYYGKTALNLAIISLAAVRLFVPLRPTLDPIIVIVMIFGALIMGALSLRELGHEGMVNQPSTWFKDSMLIKWSIMGRYITARKWRWSHESQATARVFLYLGMVMLLLFL